MGLPATYDGRNFPSVFSDVHTRSEVQEAREKVQQANGRADRLRVIALIIFGMLILAGAGAYFLYTTWQQAKADGKAVADQNAVLIQQQEAMRAITGRRAELEEMRETLRANIETMGRHPTNGTRWRATLDAVAKTSWARQLQICQQAAGCNGWPSLVYPGPSQSWDITQRAATEAMDREITMLREVNRSVDNAAALLRSGGTVAPPSCPDQRYC